MGVTVEDRGIMLSPNDESGAVNFEERKGLKLFNDVRNEAFEDCFEIFVGDVAGSNEE